MTVLINAPFNLSDEAKKEIENNIKDLSTLNDRITRGVVYFKMDDGNGSDTVTAEIELHVPGPVLFASNEDKQYKVALDGAIDKIKRQIKRSKEKRGDFHAAG
ncbi:MAG: HPF/RaiA family ribosome-associated protein [Saprospiraceae bacterium]